MVSSSAATVEALIATLLATRNQTDMIAKLGQSPRPAMSKAIGAEIGPQSRRSAVISKQNAAARRP
jgi:hypothetical protein